jgi:hypothetical protein
MTKRLREEEQEGGGLGHFSNLLPELVARILLDRNRLFNVLNCRCVCTRWHTLIETWADRSTIKLRRIYAKERLHGDEARYMSMDLQTASRSDVRRRLSNSPESLVGIASELSIQLSELATLAFIVRILMFKQCRNFVSKLYKTNAGHNMREHFLAVTKMPGPVMEIWPFEFYKTHVQRKDKDRRTVMCTTPCEQVRYKEDDASLRTSNADDIEIPAGCQFVVMKKPFVGKLGRASSTEHQFISFRDTGESLCKILRRLPLWQEMRVSVRKYLEDYVERLLDKRDAAAAQSL